MRGAGPDTRDDPTLLTACLSGERRAWTTLVERYTRYVAWLVRMTAQRCAVELDDDAVGDYHAEVFASLLSSLPNLDLVLFMLATQLGAITTLCLQSLEFR